VAGLHLDPLCLESPEKLFNYGKHFREKLLGWMRKILPPRAMNLIYDASYKWKRILRKRQPPRNPVLQMNPDGRKAPGN
jgi:hypothetical protein